MSGAGDVWGWLQMSILSLIKEAPSIGLWVSTFSVVCCTFLSFCRVKFKKETLFSSTSFFFLITGKAQIFERKLHEPLGFSPHWTLLEWCAHSQEAKGVQRCVSINSAASNNVYFGMMWKWSRKGLTRITPHHSTLFHTTSFCGIPHPAIFLHVSLPLQPSLYKIRVQM